METTNKNNNRAEKTKGCMNRKRTEIRKEIMKGERKRTKKEETGPEGNKSGTVYGAKVGWHSKNNIREVVNHKSMPLTVCLNALNKESVTSKQKKELSEEMSE